MPDPLPWLIPLQVGLWAVTAALVVAIGGLLWSDAVLGRWSGPPYTPWVPGRRRDWT
jgi:hypothetical protein